MARVIGLTGSPAVRRRAVSYDPDSPVHQSYQLLHWGYCALPVIAGLDKFTNMLTDWTQYLAPSIASALADVLPAAAASPANLMKGVGVVEILAGLLVALKPRIGGYVVAAWLFGIVVNLVVGMRHLDVALRDFGLMLGAICLARLAAYVDRREPTPAM